LKENGASSAWHNNVARRCRFYLKKFLFMQELSICGITCYTSQLFSF